MTSDEIREYLEDNGYPPHIVAGGAEGLVKRYREFVDEVESGYAYGLHDYRNDLDIRGLIHLFQLDEEVVSEDERFEPMLAARESRVWESGADRVFWDYGYPRNAGRWLMRDLAEAGIIVLSDSSP
jgi:hypothetical protein